MTVTTVSRHTIQFSKEESETLHNAYEIFFKLLDYVDENSVAVAEGGCTRWTWDEFGIITDLLLDIYDRTLIVTEE